MANKWQITIIITDLTGMVTAPVLKDTIRDKWLPPSHDITLDELKVGLIQSKDN